MSDIILRKLLADKYQVEIDGMDCIESSLLQCVINTVREYDSKKCSHGKSLHDYCQPCGRIHNEN